MSTPVSPSPDATTGPEGVRGYPSSDRSEKDGSGDLRASALEIALAATATNLGVTPIHEIPSTVTAVERAVDALIEAGWRRVTEDPGQTALDEAYALGEAEAERRLLALRGGAQ